MSRSPGSAHMSPQPLQPMHPWALLQAKTVATRSDSNRAAQSITVCGVCCTPRLRCSGVMTAAPRDNSVPLCMQTQKPKHREVQTLFRITQLAPGEARSPVQVAASKEATRFLQEPKDEMLPKPKASNTETENTGLPGCHCKGTVTRPGTAHLLLQDQETDQLSS